MTLAEQFIQVGLEKGMEKGMAKGIERGIEKGAEASAVERTFGTERLRTLHRAAVLAATFEEFAGSL